MSVLSAIKTAISVQSVQRGRTLTIAAVVLFLLFDFVALSLNIWLSYRIEQQAININLSGRQRMLSQRLVKTLLLMDKSAQSSSMYTEYLAELRAAYELFDSTLDAFYRGGKTLSAETELIDVSPLSQAASRTILDNAILEWAPLRQKIRQLIGREYDTQLLAQANQVAQQKNLKLLELMNTLTVELEHNTQSEARQIRFFQGLAFALALINFSIAITLYRLRVAKAHHTVDLVDNIINRVAMGIVVVTDDQRIVRVNHAMETLSGLNQESLFMQPLSTLLIEDNGTLFGVNQQGGRYHCRVEISDVSLHDRPAKVYSVVDDTALVTQQQELTMLAYHDQLTNLPNRLLFNDRLASELKHAARRAEKMAIVFIDLNGFKEINDRYGHKFGDLLLVRVAARMRDSVRESDTVARIGGDEFTFLLTDIATNAQCKMLLEKILTTICRPYLVQDCVVEIGASIGVACFPDDATTEDELISMADKAMYRSKASGESNISFANEWRKI